MVKYSYESVGSLSGCNTFGLQLSGWLLVYSLEPSPRETGQFRSGLTSRSTIELTLWYHLGQMGTGYSRSIQSGPKDRNFEILYLRTTKLEDSKPH